MEFTVTRNDIAVAVTHAVHGIPTVPLQSVRAGMRIETRPTGVMFSGSDGDVTFDGSALATIHNSGVAVVPGKLFSEVIRTLPDQDVRFTADAVTATVTCGRVQFRFPVYKETYPGLPDLAAGEGSVEAPVFADAVKKVLPACSKTDTNPALSAVLFEPDGDTLWMAATDRYRLAAARIPWIPYGQPEPVLVPSWTLDRFIRGADDTVEIGWDETVVNLHAGNLQVISRGIQGTFPKWRLLLPPEPCSIEVSTGDLMNALTRARLATEGDSPVQLTFTAGQLTVEAGQEHRAEDVMDAKYDGDQFTALFGVARLVDGLTGCGDTVRFGFTEPLKPVYLQSGDYSYTVLPRRPV